MRISLVIGSVIVAFVAGGVSTWAWLDQSAVTSPGTDDVFLNDLFDDEFFKQSRNPFAEMDRLRKRMNPLFDGDSGLDFEPWFKRRFGDIPAAGIHRREDDQHVFFDLDISGNTVSEIDVKAEDSVVTITAMLEQSSAGSVTKTKIDQRFPIPDSADPETMRVEDEGDRIVVIFDKLG